jgi:hypothetical protein
VILPQVTLEGADDDDVSYAYTWRLNGEKVSTAESYKVPERSNDAVIELQIVAYAGKRSTDPTTARVRIGNRAPTVTSIAIQPSLTPTVADAIKAIPRGEDPDGDPIEFQYSWRVNGSYLDEGAEELPAGRFRRGDKIDLEVVATDGNADSEPMSGPTLEIVNVEPTIVSNPVGIGEDGTFRYQVEVDDADDRLMRYALLEKPDGMTIEWLNGTIQWKPNADQAGKHVVKVEVDDQHGGKATQEFTLDVAVEEPEKAESAPGDDASQPVAAIDSDAELEGADETYPDDRDAYEEPEDDFGEDVEAATDDYDDGYEETVEESDDDRDDFVDEYEQSDQDEELD